LGELSQVFGPGYGFVVGWVYWTGTALAMSSEATAIAILVKEWYPNVSIPILGSTIIILVTLINLLGVDKLSTLESGLAIVSMQRSFFRSQERLIIRTIDVVISNVYYYSLKFNNSMKSKFH